MRTDGGTDAPPQVMVLPDDPRSPFANLLRSPWIAAAAMFCGFFGAAWLGTWLSPPSSGYVIFWLPSGLLVGALLANATSRWPWLLGGAIAANVWFNAMRHALPVQLGFLTANMTAVLLGVWLVRRFVRLEQALTTLRGYFLLLFCCAIANEVPGSLIGAATLYASGINPDFADAWYEWWIGNSLASMLVVPLLLLRWRLEPVSAARLRSPWLWLEIVGVVGATVLFVREIATGTTGLVGTDKFLVVAATLWAGLRLGRHAAALAALVVSVVVAWMAVREGHGLSAAEIASGAFVPVIWRLSAVLVLVGMLPAIAMRQRNDEAARARAAADGLRESEQRLQQAQEIGRVGSYVYDVAADRWTSTHSLDELFGIDASFPRTAAAWLSIIHPDDREACAQALRRSIGLGERLDVSYRVLRPSDGAVRWMHGIGEAESDDAGRVVRMVGTNVDVTDLKEALADLHESRQRLALSLDGAALATWDWHVPSGRIVINERWATMLGYEPREIVPHVRTWEGLLHPDDRAAVMANLQPHLEGRTECYETEHRLRHKDGSWIWVLDSGRVLARDGNGRPIRMCGTHLDITARKQVQAALRSSEARLAGILDSAMDGIITVDAAQRIVLFNSAAERIFGWTREDVLGRSLAQLIPGEHHDRVPELIRRFGDSPLRQQDLGRSDQLRGLRADGGTFPMEASISKVEVEGEKLFTVILRDVTEQRAVAEERRQLAQRLEQAQRLETLGTLAGGVAHDFNNLLTGITGNVELALQDLPAAHPVRTFLASSLKAGSRARELVQRILLFARRMPEKDYRVLDFGELLVECVPLMRSSVPEGVAVVVEPFRGRRLVRGDPAQLQQVIMNLGVNAAQAIGGCDGIVHIGLAEVAEAGAQRVRLTVTDDGVGMDETTLQRIFDPFFTTKRVGGGTGLGLSIVLGVAQAHGGTVTASSRPGEGSTFEFTLPLATATAAAAAAPEQPARRAQLAGVHIDVVDDEPAVAKFVAAVLQRNGGSVTVHLDAESFLGGCTPGLDGADVVVLDLAMPRISGPEVARRLRQLRADLPLVFISGDSSVHDLAAYAEDRNATVLSKPFATDDLLRAVEQVLGRHSR